MFKNLIQSMYNYQRDGDVISLKIMNTLTADIHNDICAAFNLARPLIDQYPKQYNESSSFVDFLFKVYKFDKCLGESPTERQDALTICEKEKEIIKLQEKLLCCEAMSHEFQRQLNDCREKLNEVTKEKEQLWKQVQETTAEARATNLFTTVTALQSKQAQDVYNLKTLSENITQPNASAFQNVNVPNIKVLQDLNAAIEQINSELQKIKTQAQSEENPLTSSVNNLIKEWPNWLTAVENSIEEKIKSYVDRQQNCMQEFNNFQELDKKYRGLIQYLSSKYPSFIQNIDNVDTIKNGINNYMDKSDKMFKILEALLYFINAYTFKHFQIKTDFNNVILILKDIIRSLDSSVVSTTISPNFNLEKINIPSTFAINEQLSPSNRSIITIHPTSETIPICHEDDKKFIIEDSNKLQEQLTMAQQKISDIQVANTTEKQTLQKRLEEIEKRYVNMEKEYEEKIADLTNKNNGLSNKATKYEKYYDELTGYLSVPFVSHIKDITDLNSIKEGIDKYTKTYGVAYKMLYSIFNIFRHFFTDINYANFTWTSMLPSIMSLLQKLNSATTYKNLQLDTLPDINMISIPAEIIIDEQMKSAPPTVQFNLPCFAKSVTLSESPTTRREELHKTEIEELRTQITSLEKKILELKDNLAKAHAEQKGLKDTVSTLETQLRDEKYENEELNQAKKRTEDKNERLNEKIKKMEKKYEEEITIMTNQNTDSEKALVLTHNDRVTELKSTIEQQKNTIDILNQQIKKLKDTEIESNKKLDNLETTINDQNKEILKLNKQLKNATEDRDRAQKQLEENLDDTAKSTDEKTKQISTLRQNTTKEILKLKRDIEEQNDKSEELQRNITNLMTDLNKKDDRIHELDKVVEDKKKSIKNLKEKIDKLNEDYNERIDALTSQKTDLTTNLNNLEKMKKTLNETNEELNLKITKMHEELNTKSEKYQRVLTEIKTEKEELNSDFEQFKITTQLKYDSLTQRNEELKGKNIALTQKNCELTTQVSKYELQHTNDEQKLKNQKKELEKIQKEITDLNNARTELVSANEKWQADYKVLEERQNICENSELTELKTYKEKAEDTIATLTNQNTDMSNQLTKLNTDINTLTTQLQNEKEKSSTLITNRAPTEPKEQMETDVADNNQRKRKSKHPSITGKIKKKSIVSEIHDDAKSELDKANERVEEYMNKYDNIHTNYSELLDELFKVYDLSPIDHKNKREELLKQAQLTVKENERLREKVDSQVKDISQAFYEKPKYKFKKDETVDNLDKFINEAAEAQSKMKMIPPYKSVQSVDVLDKPLYAQKAGYTDTRQDIEYVLMSYIPSLKPNNRDTWAELIERAFSGRTKKPSAYRSSDDEEDIKPNITERTGRQETELLKEYKDKCQKLEKEFEDDKTYYASELEKHTEEMKKCREEMKKCHIKLEELQRMNDKLKNNIPNTSNTNITVNTLKNLFYELYVFYFAQRAEAYTVAQPGFFITSVYEDKFKKLEHLNLKIPGMEKDRVYMFNILIDYIKFDIRALKNDLRLAPTPDTNDVAEYLNRIKLSTEDYLTQMFKRKSSGKDIYFEAEEL